MGTMPTQRAPQGSPLLEKVKKQTEQDVPPRLRRMYESLVTAGSKILWDSAHRTVQTLTSRIRSEVNVPASVALGVIGVIKVTFTKGGITGDQKIDEFVHAALPASHVLMVDLLEYVSQKKGIPVTPELVALTSEQLTKGLFQLFGISEEKVRPLIEKASRQQPQSGQRTEVV